MSDRNYHHGDLRKALVAAARVILERDGLAALSLRACAREAGVSHAAPQHHFSNLAQLQSAIAASGFEDFVAHLHEQSQAARTPAERLFSMGRAYVGFSGRHPALYRLMFGVEAAHDKSECLHESMSRAWTQLHQAVTDATGPDLSDEKAVFVWSVVHGHAMLRAAGYTPPMMDIDSQLDQTLLMLSRGIGVFRD